MVGIMICLFVAEDQVGLIKDVQIQKSEVGYGGLAGNKGALCLKFR